jgi:hypothetical protein
VSERWESWDAQVAPNARGNCLGPGEYTFEVHICTLKTNKPELMAVFLHILECHTNVDILCNVLIKIYT